MKCLVTGASGFVGGHLTRDLRDAGHEVVGTTRGRALDSLRTMAPTDLVQVREVVGDEKPDAVFHLAGASRASLETLRSSLDANALGTGHVVAAATDVGAHCVVVSSCYVYEPSWEPLSESSPIQPTNLYGATRVATEAIAQAVAGGSGVSIVRAFNHSGPGQSEDFLLPAIVRRAALVTRGEKRELPYGVPFPIRDMSDVRDVVRAYRLLAEERVGGVFNVGSGVGRTIRELVAEVCATVGIDPACTRPDLSVEPPDTPTGLVADADRLRQAVGWTPRIELRTTIADMWDEVQP